MSKKQFEKIQINQIRFYLIPGVIIGLVILSGLLIIQPKISQIIEIHQELKSEEDRLSMLTKKASFLDDLDLAELTEKSEQATKALPVEKNVPLMLMVINRLAQENNIELLGLTVSPGELSTESARPEKEKYLQLSFATSGVGLMVDLKEFLLQASQVLPLVRIERVDFSPEIAGLKGMAQLSVPIDSPFLAPPKTLGAIEKPLALINPQEQEAWEKITQFESFLTSDEIEEVPGGRENPFNFNPQEFQD